MILLDSRLKRLKVFRSTTLHRHNRQVASGSLDRQLSKYQLDFGFLRRLRVHLLWTSLILQCFDGAGRTSLWLCALGELPFRMSKETRRTLIGDLESSSNERSICNAVDYLDQSAVPTSQHYHASSSMVCCALLDSLGGVVVLMVLADVRLKRRRIVWKSACESRYVE